jgi:hypothetical protein
MHTVPMFASPAVHTRRSALADQLRRKYFGIRQFSSRDLAVQHDEHHPCWKTAHFLPCTRPPDVMRMHGPQRRTTFGLSERRAFVATRSKFQPMPSGGLGDDEDTVAGASFGNVRQPALLVKSADSWCGVLLGFRSYFMSQLGPRYLWIIHTLCPGKEVACCDAQVF